VDPPKIKPEENSGVLVVLMYLLLNSAG
jgi:hypothetical protein